MTPPPGSAGGLLNAIAGSVLMAGMGTLIGTPVGIFAGIYLAEFGARGWLAPVTRFINDILLSAPSIIIGLFIYQIYVYQVGHFSAWAGSFALALIVIPVVVRTTENMLRLVPDSLREAAAALGTPQWKMILMVTLRSVRAGVVTGVLLAVARISGETAPLLFTALNNQFWTANLERTDVEPSRRDLPVRDEPLQGLAGAGVGGRAPHHSGGPDAQHRGARAVSPDRRQMTHDAKDTTMNLDAVAIRPDVPEQNALPAGPKMSIRDLDFFYGKFQALKDVSLDIAERQVTAFIGPSGCGKSTLLRTLNRMYSLYPGQRAVGEIMLDGENILAPGVDINMLRAKVGMVFQKPTPFPMSIYDNIAFGVRLYENLSARAMDERVEWALTKAAMWDEAKDKLKQSGMALSGGQQQRLCIARAVVGQARSAAARRTDFGTRSNLHCEDRGTHHRAQRRVYDCDRHSQHAAGRPSVRFHRIHVPGRADRVRRDRPDLPQASEEGHRGLHHRPLRLAERRIGTSDMTEHTHKQFDAEMEGIRSGVMAMGGLVETQLAKAISILGTDDGEGTIDQVGADELAINQMQMSIDQQCSQIIAKRQPAAIDLRMILTITKIVNDLERVGDEVKKIAYKAAQTRGNDRLTRMREYDVVRAAEHAQAMLQMALDAFARLDVGAAAEVIDRDEDIDAAFQAIMRQLISYMMEDPRTITPALEIVFIAKSIERIGDHAKNIAEAVVQVVKGKDVRHATAEQIRAEVAEE